VACTSPAARRFAVTRTDKPRRDSGLSTETAADVRIVAKGGAIQIIGQITQRSLSFLFTLVIEAFFQVGGFGLYRFVTQVLAIGGQLGLAGFNYASMRFIARARALDDPSGVRSAARVGLLGSAVASAVVLAVLLAGAGIIAQPFTSSPGDAGELAFLLRVGAPYVPLFAFMQVLRYSTQAYKTMIPSVVVGNIIQPAMRFILGVALLVAGFGITGAVTTLSISMGIGVLAAAYYLRRMLSPAERGAERQPMLGPMVKFALPQAGTSLLSLQALGLGVIVLKLFESNVQVGLFGIALALQGPGSVFLSGIVNIWAPVVSDLYERGEIERLGFLYKTITRWVATFSFPIFAALVLFPELFVAIFGSDAAEAAPLVAILAAGSFLYTGTGPSGYVISMTGRPGVNFVNSIVGVGSYIALGFWLVPRYGALGMAIGDAVVTGSVNVVRVIEAKVLVGVQPYGRSFLKPVSATAAAAAVAVLWRAVFGDAVIISVGGLAVAAVVYLGVLLLMGVDPEERHIWETIKTRMLRRRP